MLRSGFLLGVGGSAAALTLLVLPSVRANADRVAVAPNIVVADTTGVAASPSFPGMLRSISYEISPVRDRPVMYATMPRPSTTTTPLATGPATTQQELPKLRRPTREGCEAPLSSLVGAEARRMVPGRCMT